MVLSPKFATAFAAVNRTLLLSDGVAAAVPTSSATSGRGELVSDPLASWQVALQSGSLAVICVLSVLGNFLVAFTLVKKDQLVLPSNRLVFNLTGANFVFSLLVLPFVVASVAEQKWLFGIFWCNFTAFLTVLFGIASILTLAAIAIDRYYAIVKPMMYTMTITTSKSTAMLLCVWFQACLCALPPLFGWSRFEYSSSKAVCSVDWSASATYTAFFLTSCVLLPFSVMAACYYHILQVARTKCRKIHVGTVTTPTSPVAPPTAVTEPAVAPPSGCARLQPKVHRLSLPKRPSWVMLSYNSMAKGVRTICVVVGVFLLTWLPYIVMAAAEAACGGASSNPVASSSSPSCVPRWYRVLATWLMYASTVGYPVVYGLYNRSIRKEMRACLCPGAGRGAGSSTKGLPQRRSSLRRLSFSGSLLEYSPFRAKPQPPSSRRPSAELAAGRAASVDSTVGGDPLASQAASLRKASQDSGAIMTESDLDTDLSFLPGYWFGRHSAVAAAKLLQFHHRLSSRLRDRSGSRQQIPAPASGEQQPISPLPILQAMDDEIADGHDPALIRHDPALIRHDPADDGSGLQCQVIVHKSMDDDIGTKTDGCCGIPFIPSVETGGNGGSSRDYVTGSEEEVTFAFRPKHRDGVACRGESIDEGIVNDCVLEDVD